MDPKWLIVKSLAQKGCNDKWDAIVSHHLQSLLGVIELTVLCAFVCKVGYIDAQIEETLLNMWRV